MILFLTCLREIREFSLQFNVNIFIRKSEKKKRPWLCPRSNNRFFYLVSVKSISLTVLQATAVEAPEGSYCGESSTTSAATI